MIYYHLFIGERLTLDWNSNYNRLAIFATKIPAENLEALLFGFDGPIFIQGDYAI